MDRDGRLSSNELASAMEETLVRFVVDNIVFFYYLKIVQQYSCMKDL